MNETEFYIAKRLIKPIIKSLLPTGWKHRFSKRYLTLILYPNPEAWNIIIELAYLDYSTTDSVINHLKGTIDYEVAYLAGQLADDSE